MSLLILTDLRRDLVRFRAQVRLGQLNPDQAEAWFTRLEGHLDTVDAYLMAARTGELLEQIDLEDLSRVPLQPGRRTATSGRFTIVEGGRA